MPGMAEENSEEPQIQPAQWFTNVVPHKQKEHATNLKSGNLFHVRSFAAWSQQLAYASFSFVTSVHFLSFAFNFFNPLLLFQLLQQSTSVHVCLFLHSVWKSANGLCFVMSSVPQKKRIRKGKKKTKEILERKDEKRDGRDSVRATGI